MKNRTILLGGALGLLALLLAPFLGAQDKVETVTGSWWATEVDQKGKKINYNLVLAQDGDEINGWVYAPRGPIWFSGKVAGTIDGDAFRFAFEYSIQRKRVEAEFEGTRNGDEITGIIWYGKKGKRKGKERELTALRTDSGAIWISPDVASSHLRWKVSPVYPSLAHMAGIEGEVDLMLTISEDGSVGNVEVVHGHPLLVLPAKEAVEQFLYEPFLHNGKAVAVKTIVPCIFER